MILVPRGLRASNSAVREEGEQEVMWNTYLWRWRIVGIFLIALTVSGCPKKTPPPTESDLGSPGDSSSGQGLQEGGLAPGDVKERVEDRIAGERDTSGGGPLQDIYFNYDEFDLSQEARDALQRNAGWITKNREAKVEVEGHCDERGTVEYNLALGVPTGQISTISYGEELPTCREATESCWQQNRRAHFQLVSR
jgi:outer membrane protein OmpA-like peptidoglycan-associated protein